jgi:hypothetical protein
MTIPLRDPGIHCRDIERSPFDIKKVSRYLVWASRMYQFFILRDWQEGVMTYGIMGELF